jgi:5-methyltetrahydropteroyltriglutamate--homocysteine methyltransferase
MAASLDQTRADHIGSLTRPQALLNARASFGRGEISEQEIRKAEDDAVKAAITKQDQIGFPVIHDGEFRRSGFQDSFGAAVSGYEVPEAHSYYRQQSGTGPRSNASERVESGLEVPGAPVSTRGMAIDRLKLVTNPIVDEYRAAAAMTQTPVKVTLISPDRVGQRFAHERSQTAYPGGLQEFIAHVGSIEHEMVQQLVDEGCPYLQIDAPGYTAYVDPPSLERMRKRGEDPDKNLDWGIKADNAVIAGFPGVTFGIHFCRGNSRTIDPLTGNMLPQWHRVGHYDAIAERLYNQLNHQRYLLEYDSDRSGSFESLRFVPKGKTVVLGLVTTKSTEVETVEFLKRRIDEAARYISIDQLALSPQCGFASGASAVFPEDVQWRKLEAICETVAQVWG